MMSPEKKKIFQIELQNQNPAKYAKNLPIPFLLIRESPFALTHRPCINEKN